MPFVGRTARVSRRRLLRLLGSIGTAPLWIACGASGPDPREVEARAATFDADLDCTDTAGLWPAEIKTRTENDYLDRSDTPVAYCFNCSNYTAGAPRGCGTCRTFKGSINPIGHCEAWTELRG
jgi:hypothetical protein